MLLSVIFFPFLSFFHIYFSLYRYIKIWTIGGKQSGEFTYLFLECGGNFQNLKFFYKLRSRLFANFLYLALLSFYGNAIIIIYYSCNCIYSKYIIFWLIVCICFLYLFLYSLLTQILTIQSPLMFEIKCANKVWSKVLWLLEQQEEF